VAAPRQVADLNLENLEGETEKMKRNCLQVVFLGVVLSLIAQAGTISGKVMGAPGESVVYVEAIAGKTLPAPAQQPVMAQKRLMFQPHILPVQQGSTVEFLNNDSVAHNVFWISVGSNKKLGHNLDIWPQNEKRGFKFDTPGAVSLLCNVHPEMTGYIVVVPTPYFALTSESGEYRIENVPDGSYSLTAWHEGIKNQSRHVDVGGDAKADFTLSR
jgi:plastocyanin